MNARLLSAIGLLLLILVSLGGIPSAASGPPLAAAPGERTLTEADDGRLLGLPAKDLLVLRLEANPSTGYLWDVQDLDRTVLRRVAQWEFEPASNLLGAPGMQVLRFAGVGRGVTDLDLVYHRPWEKGTAPARTYSLRVWSGGAYQGSYQPEPARAAFAVLPEVASSPLALPAAYNWCDLGGCTPVKNQGSCGSCWAFATVGPLESAILIQDQVVKDLSEQYLVSCNNDGWDCAGGWWAHDYHEWKYIAPEVDAGARYESDFPYTASNGTCNTAHAPHEKIADWVQLSYDVAPTDDIKQAILDHGPVTTAICVNSAFQGYNGDVFSGPSCTSINHGVTLVGWDDTKGASGAWRLRNSWGGGWGEDGYMWIEYGVSRVGYRTAYVDYQGSGSQPPVAIMSSDCTGLACTFDGTASYDPDGGSIVSYEWDFGDGGTASGASADHTYAWAGTYQVTLTVTDDEGDPGSDSESVTVSQATALHLGDLSGSPTVNKNFWKATVTIPVHDEEHNPVANATVSGTWSGGTSGAGSCVTGSNGLCGLTTGKIDLSDSSVTFAVGSVSHATLDYDEGANHDGNAVTVHQQGSGNLPPVAEFGFDCTDLTCQFYDSGSNDPDGDVVSYEWAFGDGGTATGATTSHTYTDPRVYSVRLTVTDDDGADGYVIHDVPAGVETPQMHVEAINMSGRTTGANRQATAEVIILDAGGDPVDGALVSGFWSDAYQGEASGTTGSSGAVSFASGKVRESNALFTFTVTGVAKSGYVYDAASNVETSDFTVVP